MIYWAFTFTHSCFSRMLGDRLVRENANPNACATHRDKACYTGSDAGYGCPWLVFPGSLKSNSYCGMCTECLKTCDRDNVAIFIRMPGADLLEGRRHKLDEAYKGLIMLACAFIYSTVLIGPWGVLKETAAAVGTPGWFVYAGGFLLLNIAVVPGLFWLAVRAGKLLGTSSRGALTGASMRRLYADYGAVLVPLGLTAWIAFSLSFVLVNFSYAWSSLSDPLGWGWNLFGTINAPWTPYVPGLVPFLQVPVMLAGLAAAIMLALRTARQHGQSSRGAVPVAMFCTAATLGLMALYLA